MEAFEVSADIKPDGPTSVHSRGFGIHVFQIIYMTIDYIFTLPKSIFNENRRPIVESDISGLGSHMASSLKDRDFTCFLDDMLNCVHRQCFLEFLSPCLDFFHRSINGFNVVLYTSSINFWPCPLRTVISPDSILSLWTVEEELFTACALLQEHHFEIRRLVNSVHIFTSEKLCKILFCI